MCPKNVNSQQKKKENIVTFIFAVVIKINYSSNIIKVVKFPVIKIKL